MKSWVFSPLADLTIFLCIPLALLAIPFQEVSINILVIYLVLDTFHNYLTGIPWLADPKDERGSDLYKGWAILGLAFLAILGLNFRSIAAGSGYLYTYQFLSYVAMWHFSRQQFGWVRISARKANESSATGKSIDNFTVLVLTIFPLLISHSALSSNRSWWENTPYLFTVPDGVATALLGLYCLVVLAYPITQVWLKTTGQQNYNYPKYLIIASTFVLWYLTYITSSSPRVYLIGLNHSIPYVYLIVLSFHRGFHRRPIFSTSILLGLALAYILISSTAASFSELRGINFLSVDMSWIPEGAKPYLFAALLTPVLSHYLMDGYIWRGRIIGSTDLISFPQNEKI